MRAGRRYCLIGDDKGVTTKGVRELNAQRTANEGVSMVIEFLVLASQYALYACETSKD